MLLLRAAAAITDGVPIEFPRVNELTPKSSVTVFGHYAKNTFEYAIF